MDQSLAPGPVPAAYVGPLAHLRAGVEFQAAMARNGRITKTAHFAAHLSDAARVFVPTQARPRAPAPRLPGDVPACGWVGVVVPKRWARRAVTRSGIKREIYAQARSWSMRGWPMGIVLVVRLHRAFDRSEFPSAWSAALAGVVRTELHVLMQRTLGAPAVALRV